ncbi:MAG: phosphatase PAP2 family protein [Devosia sp.]
MTAAAKSLDVAGMSDFSKPWPLGLRRGKWPLTVGILAVVFIGLLALDHPLSLMAAAQTQPVLGFFNWATRWGEADWILIPPAVLLVISAIAIRLARHRLIKLALIEMIEIYALVFVGVGLPSLVSNIVKRLVGRGRPPIFDQVGALTFHPFANDFFYESFPSGHTTTAFSAALVLGFLAPRWYWLGLIYAVAIAASRLVLGVHYPTDVYGGLLLGTLGAYAVRNYFASRRWGFGRLPDGRIERRRPVALLRLLKRSQPKAAR